MVGTAQTRLCPPCRYALVPYSPPILQTIFHSSAVTGCTDSREYFTSAMSASFLSALIAAIVTGVFNGLSALMSTQTNFPVLSDGSG
jgi:ABC-type sulfate transport system permease component